MLEVLGSRTADSGQRYNRYSLATTGLSILGGPAGGRLSTLGGACDATSTEPARCDSAAVLFLLPFFCLNPRYSCQLFIIVSEILVSFFDSAAHRSAVYTLDIQFLCLGLGYCALCILMQCYSNLSLSLSLA
jgi:hypothetical protein